MNPHPYELLASRIEQAFAAQRIQARIWEPITVTPAYILFDFTVGADVPLKRVIGLHEEIAFNIGASAVRIYRANGLLHLEVPRPDGKRGISLLRLLRSLKPVPPHTAILGVEPTGSPLLFRIVSPDVPHALISGATGSGKTALLRTIVASLALYNLPGRLQLVLIDPKGRGLAPFAALPHLWRSLGIITTPTAAQAVLDYLLGEMARRDQRQVGLPLVVVAIDELADLLQSGGSIGEQIQRLTQRGREAGIHVIAATQRPAATLVGSMLKANLPARLIGSVTSPEDAKIAAGVSGTQAERLLGRGDFLFVAKGQIIRFQAAFASETELGGLVALAAQTTGRRHRHWGADLPQDLPLPLPPPAPRSLPPGLGEGYITALAAPIATGITGDNEIVTGDTPQPPPALRLLAPSTGVVTGDITGDNSIADYLPMRAATTGDIVRLQAALIATGGRTLASLRQVYGLDENGQTRKNGLVLRNLQRARSLLPAGALPTQPLEEGPA